MFPSGDVTTKPEIVHDIARLNEPIRSMCLNAENVDCVAIVGMKCIYEVLTQAAYKEPTPAPTRPISVVGAPMSREDALSMGSFCAPASDAESMSMMASGPMQSSAIPMAPFGASMASSPDQSPVRSFNGGLTSAVMPVPMRRTSSVASAQSQQASRLASPRTSVDASAVGSFTNGAGMHAMNRSLPRPASLGDLRSLDESMYSEIMSMEERLHPTNIEFVVGTTLTRPVIASWVESHPTRPIYLSGGDDGFIRLWQFGQADPLQTFPYQGAVITRLRFYPLGGDKFGATDTSGYLSLWSFDPRQADSARNGTTATSRPYRKLLCHDRGANDFCFLGSSSSVATAGVSSVNTHVCIWDTLLPDNRSLVKGLFGVFGQRERWMLSSSYSI